LTHVHKVTVQNGGSFRVGNERKLSVFKPKAKKWKQKYKTEYAKSFDCIT